MNQGLYIASLGLQHGSICLHRHRFRHHADLKREINADTRACFDQNTFLFQPFEFVDGNNNLIRADC